MTNIAGIKKGSNVRIKNVATKYVVIIKHGKWINIQEPINWDNYPLMFLVEDFHYDRHMHCWKNYYSEYEVKPK